MSKMGRNNTQVCKLIIMFEMGELTYCNNNKNTLGKGRRNNTLVSILYSILYKSKIIIMKVLAMFMKMPWEI